MFILTAHAIEQYCSRFAPGMSHAEAKALLEAELPRADRLRERTPHGEPLWRLPCGAHMVTKRDRGNDIVVTIIGDPRDRKRRRRHRALNDRTLPEEDEE